MEVQTDSPPPPSQIISPWLCLKKTPQGKSLSPRVATQNMQLHTEASGKRSREVSPTQTTPHGTCPLSLGYGGRCPSPALRDADGCEVSAGRPGSHPTVGLRPQANTGVAGERRGDGNNLCQSCVRASARFGRQRMTTLQIQIGTMTDQLRYQRKPHSVAPLSRRLTKTVADNASAGKATTQP